MAVIPRGSVTATLYFYSPPADGSAPVNLVTDTDTIKNYSSDPHPVHITDIRGSESDFTLDNDAFQVVQDVPAAASVDFTDDASVVAHYYPEVEAVLLKHVAGANRVVIFDHTIRRAAPDAPRAPVSQVHIDQTAASAAQRVRRHLPAGEAEALLAGRYRIINVWRPLNKTPVESWPLAFASSSTLADADFVPVEHRYESGYVGETASIRFGEGQRWYYLGGMGPGERLLLQCFDSEASREGTVVKGGRVPHTAFEHPDTSEDAEGRMSIEVRALVFG